MSGGLRYQVSENIAMYGRYKYTTRDTNRDSGTSYRDYQMNVVSMGFAFAY